MSLKKGKLIVISAPSGCGKTTIVERLLQRNKNLIRSVSYTTRKPRPSEENGQDYFFVTEKDFVSKKRKGYFLESAKVFSHLYGTSKKFVLDQLVRGLDVVLSIDVQGMEQLQKNAVKEIPVVSIFIMPPSMRALKARLEKRKTETKAEIGQRLRVAKQEIAARKNYDFVVVNRKVEQAVKEIEEIVK